MKFCRNNLNAAVFFLLAQFTVAGPMPLKTEQGSENISTNFTVMKISENVFGIGEVRLDRQKRSITFPASINMTNGAIEYLLVSSHGKLHESVLKTDVEPMQLHMAKLLLEPKTAETNDTPVTISLSWKTGGQEKDSRAENLVLNSETKSSMTRGDWIYNGSRIVNGQFAAQHERSLVSIIADPDSLMNNPRRGRDKDEIWQVNPTNAPPLNTPVQITIQFLNLKSK